mgnify:FL=1
MKSVYDKDNFIGRVNYAAQCFIRKTSATRHADTCFEMFDGDAVVTALVRRAQHNPKLYAAIAKQWSGAFPQGWIDTEARYASWPTRRLSILARDLRIIGQRESDDRLTRMQLANTTDTAPPLVTHSDPTISGPSNTIPTTDQATQPEEHLIDQSPVPLMQTLEPAQFFQPDYEQSLHTFDLEPKQWAHLASCLFGPARPSGFDPRVPWSGASFRYDLFEQTEYKRLAIRRQHGGGTRWYIAHQYGHEDTSLLRLILSIDYEPTRWDYCHFLCNALERTEYAAHVFEQERWTHAVLQKRVRIQRKGGYATARIIPVEHAGS